MKKAKKRNPKRLAELIVEATKKSHCAKKVALLFSGGLDSATIGLALKKSGIGFTCYSAFVCFGKKKFGFDREKARTAAKRLGFRLVAVPVKLKEFEEAVPEIVSIIDRNDAVSVGVAAVVFFACKKAAQKKETVVLSGMGADELFAGYQRNRNAIDIEKECYAAFKRLLAVDLKRDTKIAEHFGLEAKAPLLDKSIVDFAFSLPPKEKVEQGIGKIVLRKAAIALGMPKELAFAPKKAAQYSSGMDKAIELLAKRHGFKKKGDYLKSVSQKD